MQIQAVPLVAPWRPHGAQASDLFSRESFGPLCSGPLLAENASLAIRCRASLNPSQAESGLKD